MIYVRFIADDSFTSRAIRFRTDGVASHVEYIIVNDGGLKDVPIGNVSAFGARLRGGVAHRPYNYCKPTFEEWYTFPGIEASYAEAIKFEGRKYNLREIIHLLFGWRIPFYDPEELICSILIGYSNRRAWGVGTAPPLVNPNLPTWQMTPQILYACCTKEVRKVSDGHL